MALRENPRLIVWDNFEVVRGCAEDALAGNLSATDQQLLAELLQQLRGGKTKVLITSRSSEDWLTGSACFRLPIRGLAGEERWEFCNAIVQDFGLAVDRTQDDWKKLIDELNGHPLAMRVVLSRLPESSPTQLLSGLTENLKQFVGLDAESAKLFATLMFVQGGIPSELQPWLIPLSLHERFVDAGYLKVMGKQVLDPVTHADSDVDRLMSLLSAAGLVTGVGQGAFEMHPALSRFLRQNPAAEVSPEQVTVWQRNFVELMGVIADHFAPKELHEQRRVFQIHGASFQRARDLASILKVDQHYAALTPSLAAFALNSRRFQEASELFLDLAQACRKSGDQSGEASTYHQLGMIAQEQRDFASAEQWYLKSLAITEKHGNEHGAAITYGQLGRFKQSLGDFLLAGQYSLSAFAILQKSSQPLAQLVLSDLMESYQSCTENEKQRLRAMWREANLGKFPVGD